MTRLAAIHQPTFLPWLGWWDKLARADVLVLLDDVQFPKKGGTWMNRVRMLVHGEPAWVTVPVDRSYRGTLAIREVVADPRTPWREKIARTIATSYSRAPYFDHVYSHVEELLGLPTDHVAELNETGILRIGERLSIDTGKLVRQSNLGVVGSGTDLLVSLCKAVDASAYLTGDGAGGYLLEERFEAVGIDVVEQRFVPPRYPQLVDEYLPGLSIVDALMNCGWEGTRALICGT